MTSHRIQAAARWYTINKSRCTRPIVETLRRKSNLTTHEVCEVFELASPNSTFRQLRNAKKT